MKSKKNRHNFTHRRKTKSIKKIHNISFPPLRKTNKNVSDIDNNGKKRKKIKKRKKSKRLPQDILNNLINDGFQSNEKFIALNEKNKNE